MDIEVIIERHEQRIKTLERDISAMKEVQAEIRLMNETLVTLANELKHTNEHDTYGKCISRTGTSDVIFGYNGRDGVVTDSNGLIYMRARY